MERTIQPQGDLIGYAGDAGARTAERPAPEGAAAVYDLATFAASRSRTLSRAAAERPELSDDDKLAADRLYAELTSGGRWLETFGAGGRRMILRVVDPAAPSAPVAGTPAHGPEVA